MGELCYATELFKKRNRIVLRRRNKGAFGSNERPAALVVAHTITPAKKKKKVSKHILPVTVAAEKSPDSTSCEVQDRFMDTASFARAGAPPNLPQPYLIDCRAAYESVRQAEYALVRTIEKLKRESDGSSKCIGDLRAILATIQLNLPKLAQ